MRVLRRQKCSVLLLCTIFTFVGCNAGDRHTGSDPTASENFAYTTHDALIPVIDGPNDDHAVNIDTRLYIPENASPDSPQPALLVTHGFGNNKLSTEITSTADFFARKGYIVLTYSSQGFGQSSGCIRLNSFDYDVKDVIGLIDNVLDNPAFELNGVAIAPLLARDEKGARVGMIGGSYGGGITLNVAAVDQRVRAIVPGRTWNSLQYSLMPNNLIAPNGRHRFDHQQDWQGVFKFEWTSLLFALGNAQPAQGNGGCPQEKASSGEPTELAGLACTGFPLALCQTYLNITTSGSASDADFALVRNSSIASRIEQFTTPTMLVQGQPDTIFNLNDASASYLSLKALGTPVAMIWNSAGHGAYYSAPGECEVYGGNIETIPDGCYLPSRALSWFERWLRGKQNVDTGPEFAWFQDWVDDDNEDSAKARYGHADAFPAHGMRRFYLSGAESLVETVDAIESGSPTMLNPVGGLPASYTEVSNFTSAVASPSFSALPPTDPPEQVVSFTSPPFAEALVSVGIPRARLHVGNVNEQDLVFFAKVFDVAPDGSSELIHRLIAPVRVPAANVGQAIDINLLGFAHRFEAGHSVRLSLASTDASSYNSKLADVITISSGGDDPAYFDLPAQ